MLYGAINLDFLEKGEVHPCPYLPGRVAREEAFWAERFPPELYHDFMDHGFRRAGLIVYRPVCDDCNECRPLRVLTSEFRLTKSQRRVLNKNEDVEMRTGRPRFSDEKWRLYSRYLSGQHASSTNDTPSDLCRFLYTSPVNTLEFEYRLRGRLVAVGIVDCCSRSLSSVYTYFDPELSLRSLGTLSAIREVLRCRDRSVPYYYLGYYVADCPSMNYKARFRPCELLTPGRGWTIHRPR